MNSLYQVSHTYNVTYNLNYNQKKLIVHTIFSWNVVGICLLVTYNGSSNHETGHLRLDINREKGFTLEFGHM